MRGPWKLEWVLVPNPRWLRDGRERALAPVSADGFTVEARKGPDGTLALVVVLLRRMGGPYHVTFKPRAGAAAVVRMCVEVDTQPTDPVFKINGAPAAEWAESVSIRSPESLGADHMARRRRLVPN